MTKIGLSQARSRRRQRLKSPGTVGRAPCDAPGQALSADDEENLARVAPPPFDDAPSADAPAEGWDDAEPPFDPPDLAEALGPAEGEREDEDPPFDPPDPGDEIFVCAEQKTSEPKIGQAAATSPSPPRAKPVPTISIHVSWEQSSTGDIIDAFAADPLLARAKIAVGRGGIDAAIERLSGGERPDLLIIDTNLQRGEMLAGLDRLVEVSHRDLKLIIIGSINDVGLLRDLNARGVSQYLMSTPAPDDLASMVANLYVDTDKSHLLAVIGARGGVGASTIAANIAFAVAGGRNLTAALLDLDLCFGASAFNFSADAAGALSEVLAANGEVDEDIALDRIAMRPMERLKVFTAPATPGRSASLDCASLERLVRGARRTSQFVVVDLPHLWSPWVKQALRLADDILIVAGPDLASLRNTSNMLKALRELRAGAPEPMIALSTVGAPKRPEIPLRDFAQACGVTPCASFGFDPALFGSCEMASQMLVHAAPQSKAAKAIEMLATMVTGAEASVAKASPVPETARPDVIEARAVPVATEEAKTEEQPPLELVDEAPSVDYITRARLLAEAQHGAPVRRGRPGTIRRILSAAAGFALGLFAGSFWTQHNGSGGEASAATLAASAPAQDAQTLYALARAYEQGEGVSVDLARARSLTERAANEGHLRAMHDLGVFYARGEGGASDDEAALGWFRRAAEAGVTDSQFNVGVFYERGRGVAADNDEALYWFMLAAKSGDDGAAARVSELSADMAPLRVDRARARAEAFVAAGAL